MYKNQKQFLYNYRVPGLPIIRDCAVSPNNLVLRCTKVSAIHVTATAIEPRAGGEVRIFGFCTKKTSQGQVAQTRRAGTGDKKQKKKTSWADFVVIAAQL